MSSIVFESDGTVCFNFTNDPDCPCCRQSMEDAEFFRSPEERLDYADVPDDATHVCIDCGFAKLNDGQVVHW